MHSISKYICANREVLTYGEQSYNTQHLNANIANITSIIQVKSFP